MHEDQQPTEENAAKQPRPYDGGPAYPMGYNRDGNTEYEGELLGCKDLSDHDGMSLLDAFAKQAMSMWRIDRKDFESILRGDPISHHVVADFCYNLAEAMIERRKLKQVVPPEPPK